MNEKSLIGIILRKILGWLLIGVASLGAASQVASLITRTRPFMNGVGYLLFSAGALTLGSFLVWKPAKAWRYILAGVALIVTGVIVVQTSFG
jgi:hypothetical protein